MEEFINTVDPDKFRRTNYVWNSLMLNDPWSVGYVTTLIESRQFINKEEWEAFYYEMGEVRIAELQSLPPATIEDLNNELLIKTNRQQISQLEPDIININTLNGRTKADFEKKGRILFDNVVSIIPDITLEECVESVRYRVICETWNGIIIRERNTIKTLEREFPDHIFEKKDGDFDYHYAVDYEMKRASELVCGIQVKPKSYTFNTPYLNKARSANQTKNSEYTRRFGKPVFDIISKGSGEIQNPEVIEKIKALTE